MVAKFWIKSSRSISEETSRKTLASSVDKTVAVRRLQLPSLLVSCVGDSSRERSTANSHRPWPSFGTSNTRAYIPAHICESLPYENIGSGFSMLYLFNSWKVSFEIPLSYPCTCDCQDFSTGIRDCNFPPISNLYQIHDARLMVRAR